MNGTAIILLLLGLLAVVFAFPTKDEQDPLGEQLFLPPKTEERGLRFRRVTCDLLSVSLPIGSLNHAACAAHCLSMRKGFKGGRCKEGVCHCRK